MNGRGALFLALLLNDLISYDRNNLRDPGKRIPRGRIIGRREVLQLIDGVCPENLTGAAIFVDAQVYNSERLVLSFLRSAAKAGAEVANYVRVTGFLRQGDTITGVMAKDELSGDSFEVRSKIVVNATGPWVDSIHSLLKGQWPSRIPLAKAFNIITRPLVQTHALGLFSRRRYRDADAVVRKGGRFLFITPWRNYSLVGTAYLPYDENPDECSVTEEELQNFLDEINEAYPSAELKMDDVLLVQSGLLPCASVSYQRKECQLLKQYQIRDHRAEGVTGLISVMGVKYTTARHVAEKVVDRIFTSWGQTPPEAKSSNAALYGGGIDNFNAFLDEEIRKQGPVFGESEVRRLIYNYGSAYQDVLQYVNGGAETTRTRDDCRLLKAEVLHAVDQEMAQTLSDVVFRRTEIGSAGHPGERMLERAAQIMGQVLGWSSERCQLELQEVTATFTRSHAAMRPDGTQLAGAAVQ
jgi:glycerol-3-phosphate dehydrogenase